MDPPVLKMWYSYACVKLTPELQARVSWKCILSQTKVSERVCKNDDVENITPIDWFDL